MSDLLGHPGASKIVRLSAPVEGLGVRMARVRPGIELSFDLRLDSIVEGIHVGGRIGGEAVFECVRCLTEFTREFAVDVDEVYADPARAEADEDEEYALEGDVVDLEPMVRDAVVLDLPLNPVCREDCKGLCPTCGADLNVVDCGHRDERIDARWEKLRRLRQAGG